MCTATSIGDYSRITLFLELIQDCTVQLSCRATVKLNQYNHWPSLTCCLLSQVFLYIFFECILVVVFFFVFMWNILSIWNIHKNYFYFFLFFVSFPFILFLSHDLFMIIAFVFIFSYDFNFRGGFRPHV